MTDYATVMVGNVFHVFTKIFVPSKLRSHLSRNHSQETQDRVRYVETLSFTCQCCSASAISTEKEFFEHLGRHLKKHETIVCVFKNCNFSTNVYVTFASHRSQRHTPPSLQDFKENLLKRYVCSSHNSDVDVQDGELLITGMGNDDDVRDLPNIIEKTHGIVVSKTGE